MVQVVCPGAMTDTTSVQTLIQSLSRDRPQTPQQAQQLVTRANILAEDLLPWADFDHPIEDSYGRQLLFQGHNFEAMVMSWNPGDFSAIHNHGAIQWGAVQCFGHAAHHVYHFEAGQLTTRERSTFRPGMVRPVDPTLIHQMGNNSVLPFLSLHVYGSAEPGHASIRNARIFDVLESNIQYTDEDVFFCLPEPMIKRREGLVADAETTLRHHCHMRDRIRRILAVRYDFMLEQKLTQLKAEIQRLRRGR